MHTFRKPAWLDDMWPPLSRRLSSHSACGKWQHGVTQTRASLQAAQSPAILERRANLKQMFVFADAAQGVLSKGSFENTCKIPNKAQSHESA